MVPWRNGNAFHPINEVTLRRAGLLAYLDGSLPAGR